MNTKTFEEIIIGKIDREEELSSRELSELREYEIDIEYGDNRRWSRSVFEVVELCGRYFAFTWEEGLTECQENEFYEQPYEVEKKEYQKTITISEWIKKTK